MRLKNGIGNFTSEVEIKATHLHHKQGVLAPGGPVVCSTIKLGMIVPGAGVHDMTDLNGRRGEVGGNSVAADWSNGFWN